MGDATADAQAGGGSQPALVLDHEGLQQFRAEVVARRNLATIPAVLWKILITNRLVSWTDLETGEVRPEALALLDLVADRSITVERWHELVARLRAGGTQSFLGAARV